MNQVGSGSGGFFDMKKNEKNEKKWKKWKKMKKMRKNEKNEKTWKNMKKNEILRNFEKKLQQDHVAHKFVSFQINLVQTTKLILLHSVCRGIGVQHYIFSLYLLIIW